MSAKMFDCNADLLTRMPSTSTRVYLCGPIAKNDWRHKLVPGLRDTFGEDEHARDRARTDIVTALPTITPGIECVGPWFFACDHGCAHGRCKHGAAGASCASDAGPELDHGAVYHANIARIRRADAVFAYINRSKAYGSLFELGVAMERGTPIFIGFSPNVRFQKDMWFAGQAGIGNVEGHVGPVEEIWEQFREQVRPDLKSS